MAGFTQSFRALIVPRLRPRFEICAALIVSGVSSFAAETGHLEGQAWRLGAVSLPDDDWLGLQDWIARQLVETVTRLELRQTIPGAQRDILAVFFEQEREISALRIENERLRRDLAATWTLAAEGVAA